MTNIENLPLATMPPNCPYILRHVNVKDVAALQTGLWQQRPLEDIEDFIQRVAKFKEQKRGLGIVAVHGDKIVGYGQVTNWMQCAEISDLMVSPQYRSQGVGTAIIQYLTHYSIEEKIACVELGVAESNPRAYKLYRKLGFTESYKLELDLGDGREPVIYLSLDIIPFH